jgi:hypothetical protein
MAALLWNCSDMAGTARFTELAVNVVTNDVKIVTIMVARRRDARAELSFVIIDIIKLGTIPMSSGFSLRAVTPASS